MLQARIFVKYDGKSASECANRGLRGVAVRQYRAIPMVRMTPRRVGFPVRRYKNSQAAVALQARIVCEV